MELFVEFPKNTPAWWEFEKDDRVISLRQQLHDGLLHPIEFSFAIIQLGRHFDLPEELSCTFTARQQQ